MPGYVDEQEIRSIARFVASIDPEIPWMEITAIKFAGNFKSLSRSLKSSYLTSLRQKTG